MTMMTTSESAAAGTTAVITNYYDDNGEWQQELLEGLNYIVSHFSNQEALFPRRIMTQVLEDLDKGQCTVYYKSDAISHYYGALGKNCRIAGYPRYEAMKENGLLPPTYKPKPTQLFIDLDLSTFNGDKTELDAALQETLRNIEQYFDNGVTASVLWTGGGFHIYLPLDPDFVPLYEQTELFTQFKDPSEKFHKYAVKRLTNGKSDSSHNPSFESFLWRIPGSINTKYPAMVTIVQRWNGVRARPTSSNNDFMITDFHAYLVQEAIDSKIKELELKERFERMGKNNNNNGYVGWIEKLLDTPIDDFRKRSRDLILVPYLVVRRGMTNVDEIEEKIMRWADKCGELHPLEPSRRLYAKRIRYRVKKVMHNMIPPMGFDTLKEENPELAQKLYVTS